MAIAPLDNGLVMEMLRYPTELRDPKDYFDEVPGDKPTADMLALAGQLIDQKTRPFDPTKFEDHYQTALRQLVEDKVKGRKIVTTPEPSRPSGGNVVDLMAALRKSLDQSGLEKPSKSKGRGKKSA